MAKIDDLVIQIKADTKQLKAELDKINGKIRTTGAAGGAAFGGMAAGLSKIKGPAIAAAAGIAAIAVSAGAIARVGAGFEDLKDSLDQVFGSIERGDAAMQKVFTFAQTTPFQIEDATKAFIALKSAGIEPSMEMLQTFADTASVSVDQLGTFEALIRMVQRSASGGMGLEELNMISDRGIDVLGILKDKLNLTKDDIAKFGKTAEGAAEMVKALTEGLQEKFGGAMEAKMDNLSTKTSNMIIAFKQLGDELFKSGLGDFLKSMADRLTAMANAIAKANRASRGERTLEDMGVDTSKPLSEQRGELQATAELAKAQADAAFDQIGKFGDRGQASREFKKFHSMYVNAMNEMLELDRQMFVDSLKDKPEEKFEAGKIEGLIDFQSKYKKLVQDSIPETKKLGDQIKFIEDLMATADEKELAGIMGFLGVKDISEMEAVVEHLQKLQDELDETATFSDEMQQAIVNAANSFTTDFVKSLMDGENALQSFKDFSKNIVSQIIAIYLQMAVVNKILNTVFSLTGTSALPTIGGRASGSRVQKGQPYFVGETGTEMFVPDTSGNILNSMNTKNAMGGGSPIIVNQSVNFATGVVPTVRAEVTKMMPQIADVTKGAVAEAAMRGGNFRRALQGG
jgi:hypothetical protein